MKTPAKRATGGRPTREAAELLAERIIDVATELMLQHGYSQTSIEAVASAAGVAKRTLYSRFPEKRDLFAAVLQRRREQFLAPVAKISNAGGPIQDRLEQVGMHVLEWALKADTIALRRLIVAEIGRFPELSGAMLNNSRVNLIKLVAEILEKERVSGVFVFTDATFAALQFLNMIMAPADMHAHYGAGAIRGKKKRDYIVSVVDLFLNGCRAGARPPAKRA
ncbi:MAG: transcriptional regulator, TetR family [Verrucomicrobiaceae bacterium]|nr:transcriptional regulator, TetR family [Verrucomicrobiaceae bacterium]